MAEMESNPGPKAHDVYAKVAPHEMTSVSERPVYELGGGR